MSHAWRALGAQVAVETRSRLRATGTVFTVLALFAAAFTYLPPPDAHRASILWDVGGTMHSGEYTAGFVGAVVALITAMFLPLVGFYLTTGSVTRDLERRVWPVLAATPTSPRVYLLGKWLASFAYLLLLTALSLVPALVLFLRYGKGPLLLGQLVLPWLLLAPPAMAFTAAVALLFDVTPGLRGRGGLVLYFFTFAFVFMMLPATLGRVMDHDRSNDRLTTFDPSGLVFFELMLDRVVPSGVDGVSLGLIITDKPIERAPFPPLRVDADLLLTRLACFAWCAVPLGLAMLLFPLGVRTAARPPRRRRAAAAEGVAPAPAFAPVSSVVAAAPASLRPHPGSPSAWRSVLAEARLVWSSASWLRWPLLAAALLALVMPASGLMLPGAAFLLLVAPVIAEAAARESLAGTGPLVFAQPGVPRSAAAWKLAAVGLFVLALGAPLLLRSALRGLDHGLAMLLALVFVAAAATGAGWLTGGGKLFLGAYTALWYMAIQNGSPLDFAALGAAPQLVTSAACAAVGAALALAAIAVERARAARG